ncbi:MAG: hypothetical protein H0U03_07170 [Actinobacteria bacterium]|nr:hypothetical protein [Actinomycetota bacterium]
MLTLRLGFTAAVMALVVWLLGAGAPLGAVAVVLVGVWLRQAAESGRLTRFAGRAAKPS